MARKGKKKVSVNFIGPLPQSVTRRSKPRKRKARKGKVSGPRRGTISMGLVKQVCSISNPFCEEARGAKWPDNSFNRSMGYGFHAMTGLTTDASGNGTVLWVPSYGSNYCVGTYAGGTSTFTNMSTLSGVIPTNASRVRIVSWGIKLSCVANALNAAGLVQVRLLSNAVGGTLLSVSSGSYLADNYADIPMARLTKTDEYIIPMPISDTARLYGNLDATGTPSLNTFNNRGWQCVLITIVGGPVSSNPVNMELFWNIEITLDDGATELAYARPSPPASPIAQAGNASVLEQVGNFIEGAADKVDSLFKSKAVRMLGGAALAYAGMPTAGAALALTNGEPSMSYAPYVD